MPIPDPADLNALYQEWLEIPAERLPPNHYALLGLADFEADEVLIESAAKSRSAYLHQIAAGPQRKIVQEMLGQVAIARRTLMSVESRSAYDQSLRSGAASESDAALVNDVAIESAVSAGSETSSAKDATVSRPGKKASDWKYHGISAAVLLSIVAIIFWVNRNPGGRRAAEARSTEMKSSVRGSSSTTIGADTVADQDTNASSTGQAPATRARKVSPSAARSNPSASGGRSPIAKRRETGSGIGDGLGDKFNEVLSDIGKQPGERPMPTKTTAGSPGEFRPLGGLSIGPSKKLPAAAESLEGLSVVAEFPTRLADRFECEQGFEWIDASDGEILLKTSAGQDSFKLSDKQFKLTVGSAMALTSSMSLGMHGEMQVGFEVDGIRIGLRSFNNGVELFARDRGEDARRDPVGKINTTSDTTTLSIQRDVTQTDSFRWFVEADDLIQTGTIGATSLGEAPAVGVFVSAPKIDPKRPLRLSELKTRSGQP